MNSFVDDLSTFALSLGERGQKLFSSPLHWMMLSNGDADFHDNVIFFGFSDSHNYPVLVAKVPRLVENGWMLKTEYDHLVELWNCIGEKASHYVPKPIALTTLQEWPVLMISFIPGESLTRLSRRSFWANSNQVTALAREAARSLRDLNRLTESPIAPGKSLAPDFSEKADKFRELFQMTPAEDAVLSDLVKTVRGRAGAASHRVMLQGDFWHGNMIRDETSGALKLIDWQFARWSVDVSMDLYFFLLAGALFASGDGSVEQRASDAFGLLNNWRTKVIPEYLSTYGTPDHYVLLPQKEGMMMCCVEKAVRSALEFGYSHSDDLMWRYLFAELLNWQDEKLI
ncbi:MAG TPA: aminoglycoside phosphotransferase family protein [Anaerolineales bacterium]|nr:aminoglycoside phosphotransferase family protein [Anaerolineales bacterium]